MAKPSNLITDYVILSITQKHSTSAERMIEDK